MLSGRGLALIPNKRPQAPQNLDEFLEQMQIPKSGILRITRQASEWFGGQKSSGPSTIFNAAQIAHNHLS